MAQGCDGDNFTPTPNLFQPRASQGPSLQQTSTSSPAQTAYLDESKYQHVAQGRDGDDKDDGEGDEGDDVTEGAAQGRHLSGLQGAPCGWGGSISWGQLAVAAKWGGWR